MKNFITVQPLLNPIIVGKIGGAYGVKGWVKVISFTDKIDNIFNYNPWFVLFKNQWKLIQLECWKSIGKHYIAKIVAVTNREFAMLLAQVNLIIDESQLPSLHDNEYYWKDIIGCEVITMHGNSLGYVDRIISTSAHDILEVKINQKKISSTRNSLIPFVQNKIIKNINLISNIITVDWDL